VGAAEALGGFRQNVLGGALSVGQHVRVPQTEDSPALTFQICCAALIGRRLLNMLAAVEFDPEPGLTASEIDDEGRDYQLAREGWSVT